MRKRTCEAGNEVLAKLISDQDLKEIKVFYNLEIVCNRRCAVVSPPAYQLKSYFGNKKKGSSFMFRTNFSKLVDSAQPEQIADP